MVRTYGVILDNTQVSGRIIRCMGKVSSPGPMEGRLAVIIRKIRNMEMVFFAGLMVANTMADGSMAIKSR